jgi:hypothetical protein
MLWAGFILFHAVPVFRFISPHFHALVPKPADVNAVR